MTGNLIFTNSASSNRRNSDKLQQILLTYEIFHTWHEGVPKSSQVKQMTAVR